jgi:diadenosine tetraphosphate (Ap4A) HIT family hydrolase
MDIMNCWMCDPSQYAWLEYADLCVSRLLFENEHTYVIVPRESHVKHHLLVALKEKNGQHKRGLIECSDEELAYLGSTISYWCTILKKMKYDTVYTGCYSDGGHMHFHLIPLIHARDKVLSGSAMQWLAEKEKRSDLNQFTEMSDTLKRARLHNIQTLVSEMKKVQKG